MSIQEILKILINAGIEPNEASVEVKMLIEHFCGYTRTDVLMGKKLTPEMLEIVKEKAELRAKTRQPIQHIIGFADFMGEKFIVNPHVLIPRDETEFLVGKAVEIIKTKGYKMALDVGTGSGCIACMVAKLTDCQIIGLDVSNDALNTALDNASRLNLFNKAIFRKSDVFSNVKPRESFDIIISNPPYIPTKEIKELEPEVNKFNPLLALDGGEDGLNCYRYLAKSLEKNLKENTKIFLEIGKNQEKDIEKIFNENGYELLKMYKDLAEINRILCFKKN